ncbi:MAG TPA: LPS assembly protein LptD [Thermoanaerobaculales bacterium]|nr:LPS assembly protein LptD [Thermoanaerobaculales bacterium]
MRSLRFLLLWLALLAPVGLEAAEPGEAITLTAEEQRWEGDVWRGLGGVRILYQDIKVSCDEMEYNRATQDLLARGRIVFDQGPSRFTADELHYNLGTKTGLFVNGSGFFDPMYSFSGRLIEKLDATHYRVDGAQFTTCARDDESPPWSFSVKRALLEEEGFGRFTSTALRVQSFPVFYLPYVVWPIKQERAPGLLMPTFGYSDLRGFNVGLPVYFPVGRSWDTTVFADYYSEGFWGLGNEWRWAPSESSSGRSLGYAIWDETNAEWQWRYNLVHNQADLWGFRLLVELKDLSDVDFFQEFDRTFEANTRRSLYSQVYLSRSAGPATLNLRADRRMTFLTTDDVELMQLPEAELRVRSTSIGDSPVYWDLVSSLNYFDVDRGNQLQGQYGRADLYPTLSYSLPSPLWLSVTPRLGARGTYYTQRYSEDRLSFEDESISRTYLAGGVDIVGPSVSRIFNKPWGPYARFKHLVEPRFQYAYLGGTDAEDTTLIPVFDEVDSTPLTNRVRLALANRVLARSKEGVSARELGTLEFYQDYSFDEPLNRGDGVQTSQWGNLGMLLRVTPTVGTGFDAQVSYDTLFSNPVSTSFTGSLIRPLGSARLTWYQSYAAQTGDRVSSQVRAILDFRKPNFPLQAGLHVAYDVEKAEFQQQQYRVFWQGSCWSISAEYRDLRLGLYPTREYRIVIDLKGVGALPEIKGSLGGFE